jgi:DNA-directed RNA polymerase omega subunit
MDIISLPVEVEKNIVDGRYRLTMVASQRAKELAIGAKPRVQTKAKKVTTIALQEAINGKVEYVVGEEAIKAKEEAKKFDYKKLFEEKKKEATPEELSELEKDLKVYLHEKDSDSIDKKALEELFGERKDEGAEE